MRKVSLKVLSIWLCIMLASVLACATWKGKATVGYEATALALIEIHEQGTALCEQGKIKPEDCVQLKDLYNKTRAVYIYSGDALKAAINAEDAVVREKSLESYQRSISDFAQLSIQLVRLAGSLGIKIGK